MLVDKHIGRDTHRGRTYVRYKTYCCNRTMKLHKDGASWGKNIPKYRMKYIMKTFKSSGRKATAKTLN